MRKMSKKLALPAIAVAVRLMGAARLASADFVVTINGPTVHGALDVYTLSVLNNGANNTGTTLTGGDVTITMESPGQYLVPDETQDLGNGAGSFDGINDVNPTGALNAGVTNSSYTYTVHSDGFGSATGTFVRTPQSGLIADFENEYKDTTRSWSSDANGGVVSPVYSQLSVLEVAVIDQDGGVADTQPIKFVNVVVPHGDKFNVQGTLGSSLAGKGVTENFAPLTPVGNIPTVGVLRYGSTPTNMGGQITSGNSGTVANPQGTYSPGTSTNTLTVSSSSASGYSPAYIRSLTSGTQAGWTNLAGFNYQTSTEIFLVHILVNGQSVPADDQEIAADIQAYNYNVTATASLGSLANLGGVPWDIELITNYIGGENAFGFNFSGFSDGGISNVTVTDIGVVPEPASAGLLVVGGMGLLRDVDF